MDGQFDILLGKVAVGGGEKKLQKERSAQVQDVELRIVTRETIGVLTIGSVAVAAAYAHHKKQKVANWSWISVAFVVARHA